MKPVIINNQLNKNIIWNGCILASIAHAIMVAQYPELSYEHSWDGENYNIVDGSGGRGTITFKDKYLVGAFRNENFTRTDIPAAIDLFMGAPKEVLEIAENETLEYLLEEDEDGTASPSATTAFWGDNDSITSIDSIVKIVQGGGYLLERQFMESDSAFESWRDYYEMTSEQVELLKSIYDRKVNNTDENITLTKREIEIIGKESPEDLSESMASFEEIGVYWNK
ncbi:hypothetical protein SAMN02745136_05070 [Anaerocolumna jejuensis DSM 15929]|uniref:Uncharacterized protein n=1 Tax=Anaerocolumna jejuensis DSM 15929 TaxID=1121322 RepID=A0A1M7BBD6_9FIRM|nr:hypothetical protein [Anaerocolumna jejuensis]SHL52300.1 hypothetical protein SAMN02745136_05070 [Anaerocolumna jejuensis DSM 15929]